MTNGDNATRSVSHWYVPICSVVPPGGVEPLPYETVRIFAIYHNRRDFAGAACGSMWASTPTNGKRIRWGVFVFAGASRRADRVVRPYRTLCGIADGFCNFAIARCRVDVGITPTVIMQRRRALCEFFASHTGGVEPRPYITTKRGDSSKTGGFSQPSADSFPWSPREALCLRKPAGAACTLASPFDANQ